MYLHKVHSAIDIQQPCGIMHLHALQLGQPHIVWKEGCSNCWRVILAREMALILA
jgi:hypothetical protein